MTEVKEKKPLSVRFMENTGWMIFRNVYSMLVSLIVGSLSARYLGPSNYGLLGYANAYIAFFTTISKLGLDSVVVAEMARKPEKEGNYLGSALAMRLVTSVVSFFMIWIIITWVEPDNQLLQVVTVLQSLALIFQSAETLYFWFQVRLEMKYVTLTNMLALTITGIWRLSLLARRASVKWFALSSSISALVCCVFITVIFIRTAKLRLKVSKKDSSFLLSHSYHFIIEGLAVTAYLELDRLMLGNMLDETAVGFYTSASTLAVMWEFVPNSIINSAGPILINLYDKDRTDFTEKFQVLLLSIMVMGLVVGIGFMLLGKLVVFILYGEAYYPAVPALHILIWSTTFAMLGVARSIWILSERKGKYAKYFTIFGACMNGLLNYLLIPVMGVTGAALTTLFTQASVAIVAPMLFEDTRPYNKLFFGAFRQFPNLWRIGKNYWDNKYKRRV